MSSEIRITLTIFITLVFGVFSSALVNSVTEGNRVNWLNVFCHIEFYILIVLGVIVIILAKLTAKESSEQWYFIKEKLEAMQSQGIIVNSSNEAPSQSTEDSSSTMQFQTHSRTLEFTSEAKREIEMQETKIKNKIVSFLYWLQSASVSEIVMNPNVRKVHGGHPTDFVLRIENFRISVNADLQEGKIVVKNLLKHT